MIEIKFQSNPHWFRKVFLREKPQSMLEKDGTPVLLTIEDHDFMILLLDAHEQNITFSKYFENLLKDAIQKFKKNPELLDELIKTA